MENIKEKKYINNEMYEIDQQVNEEGMGENLLLLAGFIPVVGEIADTILIIKYWRENRKIEAGLMLLALIPTVGDFLVKPFLKIGKAAGAFKTSGTFLKFLSENPAARASYAKIGKEMDNPLISKLIGQVGKKSPEGAVALKNAQTLQKGLFNKVKTEASTIATKTSQVLDRGVGKTIKQNFQNQALQKYLIKTGGKTPSNWLSRWYNVVYKGRLGRKNTVRRLFLGSNLLGTLGFPNIESFEKWLANPSSDPDMAAKLLQNPEFAQIYNQSTSDEERTSLENIANQSQEKSDGGGILGGAGTFVGLNVLKSLARFV